MVGISCSTCWLHRFLSIYPNIVLIAVMDRLVHPLRRAFTKYNVRAAPTVLQFLDYCHHQIQCIQHFPYDPPAMML